MRYLLILGFLLTTSCSRLEIALQWADVVVAQITDSYFDIESEQKKKVKAAVNRFISEGREKEFKSIANTLNEVANRVDSDPLTAATIEEFYGKAQNHIKTFLAELAPYVGEQSLHLTLDQWNHYLDKTKKQVEKNEQELAKNPEKIKKQRENRFKDQFDFWLGKLNKEQKEKIRKFVEENPFHWQLLKENRLALAAKLAEPNTEPTQKREFIEKMLNDFSFGRNAAYVEAQQAYQKKVFTLTTDILTSLDSSQRKHLSKTLTKLSKSFSQSAEK